MERPQGLTHSLKTSENFKIAYDYASAVVSGEIVANKYRIKGCQRFLDDLKNEKWEINIEDAEFVVRAIETLFVHKKGQRLDGSPLRGNRFY